jgi:hypothetical protein
MDNKHEGRTRAYAERREQKEAIRIIENEWQERMRQG